MTLRFHRIQRADRLSNADPDRTLDQLVPMLRCPITGQPLRRLSSAECAAYNRSIAAGRAFTQLGRRLTEPLLDGLISDSGSWLYAIQHHTPQLLSSDAIDLEQL